MSGAEKFVRDILVLADIQVNGSRPWDIQVQNSAFFPRVMSGGSLALGESYMDGWWSCKKLDELMYRIIRADLRSKIPKNISLFFHWLRWRLCNVQSRRGSKVVAEEHYDLGNNLYEAFLDPYNQYTCGYFKDTDDLHTAQEQKLDLMCRKLQLKESDRVLDIGCGWGGFSKFAAKNYGCSVTGITISKEQQAYAKRFCEGLPVDIQLRDYRDVREKYDKVLICGMIEHVGYKNYRKIMEVVHNAMEDDGLFLLHTIGGDVSITAPEPWVDTYIFPNSMLPSIKQLAGAFEGLFVMEDWQNFGAFYEKTLLAWYTNFCTNWPKLKERYGDRFFRMFEYYFLSCAGGFRARYMQLWQVVLSKKGIEGGYMAPR
ncbi:cyclopropane-fatty-acyl-phospholipid synthase [Candidatus Peregrinibacteria bacterium CG10_big_fil_rev_8_21_14_0_10_49_16]|nr:MAG: cyclopropane-fatty-acyl-phospholipid synthase [Candidatus Peregrinibacteria bacterium CG22_combo_CG10-13_8_21_14_all_49_11]PIR52353.1 MAG: cyclopropane-fatty-acyl-phospholipid synthase [Candidatus Peregrinibacteria bacterium CG10_big_fil_rev_8_21_14_0_10_49_16]